MPAHPVIAVHVLCAVIALLSGYLAMVFRKGSGLHGAAGSVFWATMIGMSLTGAYAGAFIGEPVLINVVAGLIAFYLTITAWRAVRNRSGAVGNLDRALLALITGICLLALGSGIVYAITKSAPAGVPPMAYFIFGSCALWCVITDVRMLKRGSLLGAYRLRRHLWRMGWALGIATLSLYPGRPSVFPQWLKDSNLLFIPHVLLLGSILFWTARVSTRRKAQRKQAAAAATMTGAMEQAA